MSNISFSLQFSQQWRNAPVTVKQAIAQELKDIIQLLDQDTSIDDFEFTHPDLNGYLDRCYTQDISQSAPADNTIDNNVQQPVESQESQEEVISSEDEVENIKLIDEAVNSDKHDNNHTHTLADTNTTDDIQDSEASESEQASISITEDTLLAIQKEITHQLEMHIEDYLSEHMTTLSESLKLWLKEEVKSRIQAQTLEDTQ